MSSKNFTRNHLSFGERYPDVLQIFYHLLFSEALIIFTFNLICLCIIFKHEHIYKRFHNIYLAGLLSSHTANGLSFILHYIFRYIQTPKYLWYNILRVRDIFYASAVGFTLLLSIDRYLAVKKPFYYATLTKKFVVLSCIMNFIVIAGFKVTESFSKLVRAFLLPIVVVVGITIGILNSILYNEVKKQYKKIALTTVHDLSQDSTKHSKYLKKRQMRSLKICTLITITYILFWVPYTFVVCLFEIYNNFLVWKIRRCFEIFALLDSIIDVAIFVALNRDVKNQIYKLISISVENNDTFP